MPKAIQSIDYGAHVRPWKAGTGGVTKFAIVIQGAAPQECVLPAGVQPTSGIVGVALHDAAAGQHVDVATDGAVVPVVASATMALGAKVAAAGTDGRAVTATTGQVVGELREAATVIGQRVGMVIRIQKIT